MAQRKYVRYESRHWVGIAAWHAAICAAVGFGSAAHLLVPAQGSVDAPQDFEPLLRASQNKSVRQSALLVHVFMHTEAEGSQAKPAGQSVDPRQARVHRPVANPVKQLSPRRHSLLLKQGLSEIAVDPPSIAMFGSLPETAGVGQAVKINMSVERASRMAAASSANVPSA